MGIVAAVALAPTTHPVRAGGRWRLRHIVAIVGVVVALAATTGIPGTAARGAQVTADEPQYLLTAGALYRHHNLDIGPDLRAETWRAYHRADLPRQTAVLPGGQRLSPHDPLLPLILAVPFGLGGRVGAKLAMALMAGVLAALLVWIAVVRFRVPRWVAAMVMTAFGVVPPLVAYGTQIYPELPAALAVTVAIAAVTGRPGRRTTAVWVLAVTALPWLAVKYAPVALALALVGFGVLAAARRPKLVMGAVVVLALGAVGFGAFHQGVYGGWTVYAVGNHFGGGELTVMGTAPDYAGRSQRLIGLFTDRDFGLLAWAPAFLAALPAFGALVRRRPPGWLALGLPLGAGWLNATFVALTMHGWWWPGRQVVVVVPCIVLAIAWYLGRVVPSRPQAPMWASWRLNLLGATMFGAMAWLGVQVATAEGTSTVIVDFARTANPVTRAWRILLPDLRVQGPLDTVRSVVWLVLFAGLAVWGWRQAGPRSGGGGHENA